MPPYSVGVPSVLLDSQGSSVDFRHGTLLPWKSRHSDAPPVAALEPATADFEERSREHHSWAIGSAEYKPVADRLVAIFVVPIVTYHRMENKR